MAFSEMDLLASAASAMSAQRSVLDIAARNVAAAQASTPSHPYARLVAQFRTAADPAADEVMDPDPDDLAASAAGSAVVGVRSEPGSGDALTEMIAVLDAQRAYEQNASIFDTAKRLAERTIDVGRG
ncbi:MAG: flagellar basal body rod C-terminal domain-containing protein [Candidatus Velthaea sp.]|jgi:flagellar basal-body rod protein FlgC